MLTLRELVPIIDPMNQVSVRDNDGKIIFIADPADGNGIANDLNHCDYLDYEIKNITPRAHHLIVRVDVLGGKLRKR